MTPQTGRRWAKRAARLRWLPVTRAAWADGTLSGGQVEVILAHLRDRTASLFAEHEIELIPTFAPLTIPQLIEAMQDWAERADATTSPDDEPPEPERTCSLARTLDGRGELRASVDTEGRQILATALRLAETPDGDHDPKRSPAHKRGDALVELAQFYCDHQHTKTGGRHRPHLNVIIDLDDLQANQPGLFFDQTTCDRATARRIACDAGIHRVLRSGSTILDYGRTTRTIPPATFTALAVRDGGCRFPDCDRPVSWCDGHHLWHWTDGGPTDLANLALLCKRHHQRVHKPGWKLRLLPDATLEITTPAKKVLWSRPRAGPPHQARPTPAGATT